MIAPEVVGEGFPAHAGMNRIRESKPLTPGCVPRTRGNEPPTYGEEMHGDECSPHTR